MAGYKEVKDLIDTHMGYINTELKGIGDHLGGINNHLEDHSKRILTLEVQEKPKPKPSRKVVVGRGSEIAGIIALAILFLGQTLSWW